MPNCSESSIKNSSQPRSGIFGISSTPLGVPVGIALIVLITFITYIPSLSCGFIWDDGMYLTDNPIIKDPAGLSKIWRSDETVDFYPISNTALWIEWRLWGMNAGGYHAVSLILHIVESLLIWLILRKLSIPGAFLAAMIFAVHPVNVESVAWIAQRKDMMAFLFFLLSILWYLMFLARARVPPTAKQTLPTDHCPLPTNSSFIIHPSSFYIWYWLSLAAFVLAMLCKGTVPMLPVILLGIIWWLRPLSRWDILKTAPFFVVAAVLTGVHVWFQTKGTGEVIRDAGFVERLLGAGGVVWFYLYKAIFPINLMFVYPQWEIQTSNFLWWMPLFAIIIVTVMLWLYRDRFNRAFLFAWGFFCVSLIPVMGFSDVVFFRYSLVADHYQHIAIIGVIALATAFWNVWHRQSHGVARQAAEIAAAISVMILAFLSWHQIEIYRDEATLYRMTLVKNPKCWMAMNNLGNIYLNAGRVDEAMDYFHQVLRLNSDNAEANNNIGTALARTGRLPVAIDYYRQALRLKPKFYNAQGNLGTALVQAGRIQEAIDCYRQALSLYPDAADLHNNLGDLLIKTGRPQDATIHCEEALRLKPNLLQAHNNLGIIMAQTGRPGEAIKHYEQALMINPDVPETHNNIGVLLVKEGRPHEAIEHYRKALQLRPDYINAWNNMAQAYAKLRQSTEAIASAQKALELAQAQHQTETAKQIENWLNSYRDGISN
jgi:protein O-mannosyl-transferase